MEVKYNIPIASEIFGNNVGDYHSRWEDWKRNYEPSSTEDRDIVQCAKDDQITIGEIYIDGTYSAKDFEMGRGKVIVSRAQVNQGNLRKSVNPYQFGNEKEYVYPFWHREHLWQVLEHLGHGTRNKWYKENGGENDEMIITRDGWSDVKSHLFFKEDISAELIWQNFQRRMARGDTSLNYEIITFAYYNADNERLAGQQLRCFTRVREWKNLVNRLQNGDESARDPLIKALKSQRIRLDRIGRRPVARLKNLVSSVENGSVNYNLFEDFFSMWDLRKFSSATSLQ